MRARTIVTAGPATLVALVLLAAPAGAAGSARGGIDVDLRQASGALVGHLHGHVGASGSGRGTFRPDHRLRMAGEVLALRTRRTGDAWTITGRGPDVRLDMRMDASGAVHGSGTADGRRVRVAGIGRERAPRLGRGMRMLVVGNPSGEGYDALTAMFEPVRYDPERHHRAWSLRDRRAFHSYAALVFGPDVSPRRLRAHGLLRAFYGAGKWVIAAPALAGANTALGAVHPYVHHRPAPAIAVRSAGPEGSQHLVKPVLLYPEAALRGRGHAHDGTERRAVRRRAAWFRKELQRMGAAHPASVRDGDVRARAAQTLQPFSLSTNARGIEISLTYNHEFRVAGSQGLADYHPCAWNQSTWNAWCEDTWFWHDAMPGDKSEKCKAFLAAGYHILDRETVARVNQQKNADGAYTVIPGTMPLEGGFEQVPGDACPEPGAQLGRLTGTDYYYALLEVNPRQHTIVALTDATIVSSSTGKLWRQDQANGTWHRYLQGGTGVPFALRTTGWFLGRYTHELSLAGTQLSDLNFAFSGNRSWPTSPIEFTDQTTGQSKSSDFSIGVFGDTPTLNYGESSGKSASVTVRVPSWKVVPSLTDVRTVTYDWLTNTPVTWDAITSGGGGSWNLNAQNNGNLIPTSMSVWAGPYTWGMVNVDVRRTLHMVEHYTRYDRRTAEGVDRFAVKEVSYSDSPDGALPSQGKVVGPGLNLCDVNVMSPDFKEECAALEPTASGLARISVYPRCQGDFTGPVSFKIAGVATGDVACDTHSKEVEVPSQQSADVAQVGGARTATSIQCSDTTNWVSFVQADADRLTIPGGALTPGRQIMCSVHVG